MVEQPYFYSLEPHLSHALMQFKRCPISFFTQPQQMTTCYKNLKIPHAVESAHADLPQVDPGQENPVAWSGGWRNKQKQKKHKIFKDASFHPVSIQKAHDFNIGARIIFSFNFTRFHR